MITTPDSLIILVHEIYGINQFMMSFSKSLSDQGFDVICPNLLERETAFDYSQEKTAYQHFINNVGFTHASDKIKLELKNNRGHYQKVYIVGFSIGATIAWLCSEETYIDGIVGYYGSRIRDYLDIVPKCPTLLFFSLEEHTFGGSEFISNLAKHQVEIQNYNGKHGFSDRYSQKYNEKLEQKAYRELIDFLSRSR